VSLETNLQQFLRYSAPATIVAVGGVVVPFFAGAIATIVMGFGDDLKDPTTLFVGAIMAATSVGITARILSDRKKLDTPEGVTILGAAVVDDVLGVILLSIVVGITATGEVSVGNILEVGIKAFGFWLGLTFLGILISRYISSTFLWFRSRGAVAGMAVALAFLASGAAESFGLAMIIGAYSIGLALSTTPLARSIEHSLLPINELLVPVFFVSMGMLVDLGAMREAIGFGAVITVLAIVGKLVGAGAPALATGFNRRGALRIGVGMVPRGEVALVIAGVGLARNAVEEDIFGVAILMTLVTTLLAPLLMAPLFDRGGPGRRSVDQPAPTHIASPTHGS
jgi:Kef-type K+ transport system membrane component KefB